MSSRENILSAIEKNKPQFISLETLHYPYVNNTNDVKESFIKILESIHTEVKVVDHIQEVADAIQIQKNNKLFVLNAIKEITDNDVAIIANKSSAELDELDFTFVRGDIGVAENGAIWVSDENITNRILPFICKHLVLVIDAKNIVPDMHVAYQNIKTNQCGFGVFISGPSKTADIEQSLVIGAHGPLELTVYIIQS